MTAVQARQEMQDWLIEAIRWRRKLAAESGERLREHQGSGKEGWTRWTRRFIRGASWGCKVRVQPGIHRRPNRRCRTGATWGTSMVEPKDWDAGATWKIGRSTAQMDLSFRATLKLVRFAPPVEWRSGETRKLIPLM